jgi:hypothetical protein
VTKVVTSPVSGEVTTGHLVRITLDTSEAVNVIGTPELLLNDGGMATYDSEHSTAKTLAFDYIPATGAATTDLAINGIELPLASSIADAAGHNVSVTGAGVNLGLHINTYFVTFLGLLPGGTYAAARGINDAGQGGGL